MQSETRQTEGTTLMLHIHDILEKAKLETEKLNKLFPRASGRGMGLISEGHKGPARVKLTFCIFTEMVADDCMHLPKLIKLYIKKKKQMTFIICKLYPYLFSQRWEDTNGQGSSKGYWLKTHTVSWHTSAMDWV